MVECRTAAASVDNRGNTEIRTGTSQFTGGFDLSEILAERRRNPRYPLACPLWFIDADGATVVRSHTKNVSTTGAFVLLPNSYPLRIGQKVELRMALPHESDNTYVLTSYDGEATVVRAGNGQEIDVNHRGVGIHFDKHVSLEVHT